MRQTLAAVAGCVLLTQTLASAQTAVGELALPVPIAEVATAVGLTHADPATLPLDLVRLMYASPRAADAAEATARAEVARVLRAPGKEGDWLPLPLTSTIWRERLLQERVSDEHLAEAILGRRATALIYFGMLAVDQPTLQWLMDHPSSLDALRKNPATAAVFARSLHIRNGAVVTPGENATDVWTALVHASPAKPEEFIDRLLSGREGRLAFLYDTVGHLDAAHQKFALAAAAGEDRIARAKALLDTVSAASTSWKIDERPFARPDVDISLVLRLVLVNEDGSLRGLTSRRIWSHAFNEREAGGEGGSDGPIDAAWIASRIVRQPSAAARERLDMFLLAQRVVQAAPDASASGNTAKEEFLRTIEALRGLTRYPALMLTLERCGIRGVDAYAAAARLAERLERDPESLALTQSAVAIVDRASAVGTMTMDRATELLRSLLDMDLSGHGVSARVVEWMRTRLIGTLRIDLGTPTDLDSEAVMILALAGRPRETPPVVDWEGRRYLVDVAAAERLRLTHIRRAQAEVPLERAFQSASSSQGLRDLVHSLTALIYALALGDPDGAALAGGAVWRRHRFVAEGPGASENTAWCVATESFGPSGWHLVGSLLALESAIPRLALRRLDPTSMPPPGRIGSSDRHAILLTVALMNPSAMTADRQAAVATAIARGRERVEGLASQPDSVTQVAQDAGLSEWRANGLAWLVARDPSKAQRAFTMVELYRLGRTTPVNEAWGAATMPIDGSLGLRLPVDAWEEYAGRPGTGLLGSQLADVGLRTAEILSTLQLPSSIGRDVVAFAMEDVLDRAQPAHFDDFLSIAFAARDLERERFEDYIAALTASGPLMPPAKAGRLP